MQAPRLPEEKDGVKQGNEERSPELCLKSYKPHSSHCSFFLVSGSQRTSYLFWAWSSGMSIALIVLQYSKHLSVKTSPEGWRRRPLLFFSIFTF